jgi:hypothetical protein
MMIDTIGNVTRADEWPLEENGHHGVVPELRATRDRPEDSEPEPPQSATSVAGRRIEANRRNAQKSTGPRTEAGKQASRLNAVTHGLLAQVVVIPGGDHQEDPEEFAHLLEDLRLEFAPEGRAEDLEVQKIAVCYWRKVRAVRYEQGTIRKRLGDIREREERGRQVEFDETSDGDVSLEETSLGIAYLIENLEKAKRLLQDRKLSAKDREWLGENFPDAFPRGDRVKGAEETEGGPEWSPADRRAMLDGIEEQLRRLSPLREEVAAVEERALDSKLRAAALPGLGAVDKLLRYETSNERELDRALKRLERMQERRRAKGGAAPEQR